MFPFLFLLLFPMYFSWVSNTNRPKKKSWKTNYHRILVVTSHSLFLVYNTTTNTIGQLAICFHWNIYNVSNIIDEMRPDLGHFNWHLVDTSLSNLHTARHESLVVAYYGTPTPNDCGE